ncbi:hypothetical protein WMY93_018125 [Mugilogobius chulae]|uniref:AN1-type domain-containing protein n=1 Tax=Mugilogobius chulae TaxID=88201 RepID=A0AAW0NI81_9GOBI
MADRKEPPFFNDESVGAFQYKLPFYDTMELYIETLTGTCFELRVLPFEAVISVKAKIRVTMEEPTKDVAELMESTKEEGSWDKSTSNKQVTFVVYREGDQLNFFRVVDRGDGTLTPLSESMSSGSVYNVYTEGEEDGESTAAQHSRENSITMSKMKLLKAKMEDMNLNKSGPPHLLWRSSTPPHRLFRSLSTSTQPPVRPVPTCLPSRTMTPATFTPPRPPPPPLTSPPRRPPPTFTSPSCYMLHEEQWDTCPPLANIRPPPKVSRLDMGGRLMRDCVYPQLPPLCTRGAPEAILDPGENLGDALGLSLLEETAGLMAPSQPSFAELGDPLTLDVSSPQDASAGVQMSPSPLSTWTLETRERAAFRLSPSSPLPAASTSPNGASRTFETQTLVKPVSPLPPRLRGVKVESPGRRPELISKMEARGITRMANQACKEPVGSVSQSELMATLSTRPIQGSSPGARLPTLSTRLHPEAAVRQTLPLHRSITTQMAPSSHTSVAGVLTSLGRIGSSSHPLPPVRASAGSKKKSSSSKFCFHCGKKTGLATSYECRCGQNFCATHRYAETHTCTYDYKSAGRRLLQETNPLISAPKLPKI